MSQALPLDGLETALLSDVGRVRTENQDAGAEFRRPGGERLLVVADGMGGHQGGQMASRLAVEVVNEVFQRGDLSGEELLEVAIEEANERVYDTAARDPSLHGMGTTAVLVLLEDRLDGAWIAHVGDSRIYRLRDGRMEQLTEDHSAVAEMVRRGVITPEEAATHPRRNEILRSLGVHSEVDPTIAHVDLREGDQILLCSDGLSGVLSDEEVGAVLMRSAPADAVRTLVDSVNERGAPDNVTVLIAAVRDADVTDLVSVLPEPRYSTLPPPPPPPRPDVRRVAAAAAAVALLLAALLVFVLLQGGFAPGAAHRRPSNVAGPVEAGPDVAAPPGRPDPREHRP